MVIYAESSAVLAWLLRRYGEPIREFIEKRLGLIAIGAAAILVLLYVAFKLLSRSFS